MQRKDHSSRWKLLLGTWPTFRKLPYCFCASVLSFFQQGLLLDGKNILKVIPALTLNCLRLWARRPSGLAFDIDFCGSVLHCCHLADQFLLQDPFPSLSNQICSWPCSWSDPFIIREIYTYILGRDSGVSAGRKTPGQEHAGRGHWKVR